MSKIKFSVERDGEQWCICVHQNSATSGVFGFFDVRAEADSLAARLNAVIAPASPASAQPANESAGEGVERGLTGEEESKLRNITERCEANQTKFSNKEISWLLVMIESLRRQN